MEDKKLAAGTEGCRMKINVGIIIFFSPGNRGVESDDGNFYILFLDLINPLKNPTRT